MTMRLNFPILISILMSIGFSTFAFGAAQVANMPGAQACMSKITQVGSSADLKSQFGINMTGGDGAYMVNGIATAASRLKALGKPEFMNGMNVEMFPGGKPTGDRCSSVTPAKKHIKIVASCPRSDGRMRNANSTSISLNILHEVGHAVGQGQYYNSYHSTVPKCGISPYCTDNTNNNPRNEEFAEVFAAFVHSPNTLKAACPQAYAFMAKNVFQTEGSGNICNGIPASNIAASSTYGPSLNAADNVPSYPSTRNNLGVDGQLEGLGAIGQLAAMELLKQGNQQEEHYDPAIGPKVIPRRPAQMQCNANASGCSGAK